MISNLDKLVTHYLSLRGIVCYFDLRLITLFSALINGDTFVHKVLNTPPSQFIFAHYFESKVGREHLLKHLNSPGHPPSSLQFYMQAQIIRAPLDM